VLGGIGRLLNDHNRYRHTVRGFHRRLWPFDPSIAALKTVR
jgi:hypothetical protein